jgi:hypothetical protein
MGWILTSNTLPQDMEEVLLFGEEAGILIGYYSIECACFIRELDGLRVYDASHWMPLPSKPQHMKLHF